MNAVRLAYALAALVVGAAGVAIAAVLSRGSPPVATSAASSSASASAVGAGAAPAPAFPAPPSGAIVFARELGLDALGLAVEPARGKLGLQASVVGPEGSGVAH